MPNITAFVNESLVRLPSGRVRATDAVAMLRAWCVARGLRAPTRSEALDAFQAAGFVVGVARDRTYIIGLALPKPPLDVVDGRVVQAV